MKSQNLQLKELQQIPGVGKSIAKDLLLLKINKIEDLKGKNPEMLYEDLCSIYGVKIDKCMLYVFRCAVYYASENEHDKEKLKWWNWKY